MQLNCKLQDIKKVKLLKENTRISGTEQKLRILSVGCNYMKKPFGKRVGRRKNWPELICAGMMVQKVGFNIRTYEKLPKT